MKRANSFKMDTLLGHEFKVQNKGLVRVIDYMGNDAAIVQMARCSYGEGTKTVNEDRGLIRYLMEHAHTSPFEGCVIKLHLKMPIFVARQWIRHRTASLNEYSGRYSEMKDEFFFPEFETIKAQSKTNKQGSDGALDQGDVATWLHSLERGQREAYDTYQYALDHGVSREMARINLPLSIYTEFYWQMNLHNLLHFLKLRCDSHAQKEIRDYADVILDLVREWVPLTAEAFDDFVLEGEKLSRMELAVVRKAYSMTKTQYSEYYLVDTEGMTKRQAEAFCKKVGAEFLPKKKEEGNAG